ncbi:CHAT domain-containing protein, partial [Pseudanabaenaceae cyanobacterium LEGE 13415]|nr:CHAT domain-containing protein [Pseudanabaenaceae cyanobacterium LEGE 13415]
ANSTGNIVLSANQRIWFQQEGLPTASLGQGGTVTFRAGSEFISDVDLLSAGRSIDIQAPRIQTQSINTALGANAGSISLTGLNGQPAQSAIVANLITSNQDVTIRANQISTQFILTNASSNLDHSGTVTLQSQDYIRVGGVLTNGKPVTLSAAIDQPGSFVQSGTIRTIGGAVTMQADRINTGLIWTSPDTSGNAGNVSLNARTDLRTSRIEANGKGTGSAGDVQLINRTGDVLIDSIQAYGGQQGGRVNIQGDRIQIVGRNFIQLNGTIVGTPETATSIRARESITIQHQGGKTNQPFIIGDPTINGTAGALQIGETVLDRGLFAIQANPVESRPIDRLSIVSQNDAPVFSSNLQAVQFFLKPGQSLQFTLTDLGLRPAIDRNQDQIRLLIRPTQQFLEAGGRLLDPNGLPISLDRSIQLSDRLTYVAPRQNAIVFDAFEVIAIDVPFSTMFSAGTTGITLRFDNLQILPQSEPAAPEPESSTTSVAKGSSISNVSSEELAAMDAQLSEEFRSAGIQANFTQTLGDPSVLIQQIEKQTGIRSAFVYLRSAKNQGSDELVITWVTAKGRFQRRVLLNPNELSETVTQFRREVTNPLRTHTKSYLPTAKQLYRWIISPIEEDLTAQGITNLVFLPEAGLRSLPYSALHNGRQFLIERFSVGLMPSLSLTRLNYQKLNQAPILAIGISEATQGQAPLPMVRAELSTIAQLWKQETRYLNQEATLQRLQTARQRQPFQVLHLATHANFRAGQPKEAYIQLWNEQLKLEQIRAFDWNTPPVELLVLSACRTAIGDRESELGFAGLAIQAGVKTTVASLWSVNDAATTALISQFYDALMTAPSKADALRQAQLAMARGQISIEDGKITGFRQGLTVQVPEGLQVSDPNFRHPYYWAAFTMVGNPW